MSFRFIVLAALLLVASPVASQDTPTGHSASPATAPAGATPPSAPAQGNPNSLPAEQVASKPEATKFNPNSPCVTKTTDDDFGKELSNNSRPVGDTLVIGTRYLPTGERVDVGVRTRYVEGTRYFAAIERDDGVRRILDRGDVVTRRAVAADNLVKNKLIEADQTIVTIELTNDDAGWWHKADIFVYTCAGSPSRVSRINKILAPYKYSWWATTITVIALYMLVGWYMRKHDGTFQSYFTALNPAKLSAGPDGKGSLSKFQVLSFSLLVFVLILLLLLQTGELSDLSVTVLGLLGISGLGATLAKGADGSRNVLTPDNKAWLIQHNWLPAVTQAADNSNARWRDFFATDGEFDVYRFQSFIFSLVVGFSMVAAGVTQLSTFSIPETILGIVGLSQAVYIGGKLVTPTSTKALNDSLDALRDREKKLRGVAFAANNNQPIAALADLQRLGANDYNDYKAKASEVRAFFTSETGLPVRDGDLEPRY